MMERADSVQLRLRYWELNKKQKRGTFTQDDVVNFIYVCTELGRVGYVLNEDESDWILPPETPRQSD